MTVSELYVNVRFFFKCGEREASGWTTENPGCRPKGSQDLTEEASTSVLCSLSITIIYNSNDEKKTLSRELYSPWFKWGGGRSKGIEYINYFHSLF